MHIRQAEPHASAVSAETPITACVEGGPTPTAHRLCCDAARTHIDEDANGVPLSIGRKRRAVPHWLERALSARDGGCRFPGSSHVRFLHAHHIEHWLNGGETALDNLTTLCWFHHRLVHEGEYRVRREASSAIAFTTRAGLQLSSATLHCPSGVASNLALSAGGMYRGDPALIRRIDPTARIDPVRFAARTRVAHSFSRAT